MNVTAIGFSTRIRTWLLVAGLTPGAGVSVGGITASRRYEGN